MNDIHWPRVRIITPKPDSHGFVEKVFTKVEIDGQWWPVTDYEVRSSSEESDFQTVVLTFIGHVTIETVP